MSECKHGQLARQCPLCERDEIIAKDEALLRDALEALHALRVVCGHCKDDEAEVRAGHVIAALRERLGVKE